MVFIFFMAEKSEEGATKILLLKHYIQILCTLKNKFEFCGKMYIVEMALFQQF